MKNPTLALLLCAPLLLVACQRPGTAASAQTGTASSTASGTAPTVPAGSTPAGNNLDAAPSKTTALQVQVVTARAGSLNVSRTASGTVKSSRDSDVAAQTSGAVARVLVQVGDRVSAGQAVVVLDDTALRETLRTSQLQLQNAQINLEQASRNTGQNVDQLQASVTSAQANLSKAQQTEAANRNLYGLGGISRADLVASQAALAQAQSELAQSRNALAQNGQGGTVSVPLLQNQVAQARASLTQAQSNLSRTTIRAPFAGVIATLPASVGEYVQTGTTAFRLVDTSALSVDFNVAPSDASGLPTGTPMNIGYGDQKLTGKVKEGDRVAGTDRLVPISVRLDGTPALPVGAAVQVRYRLTLGGNGSGTGGSTGGLQLPVAAIQQSAGSNVVFVNEGGVAQQKTVGIVAEAGDQAVVSGLNEGDQVISPVPPSLADGSAVTVATGNGATGQGGN
ncbi:efflux RND transporter periplasmic adaptor subunit [Deinococcus altitudinis]|uniref:efflux RND transporter periplasmic adaptor subunit n=1 Tax=Deinococcus altitudinis TaxID=468914 RepID=UPI003891F0D7